MGDVVISPNLKKTSQRILPDGRIMDVKSKQIVGTTAEEVYTPPFVPSSEQVKVAQPSEPTKKDEIKTSILPPNDDKPNPLKEAIKSEVQKAVQEQIKSIDIAGMVAEAMKEAFK